MLKKKARRMAAAMMAGILTCSLTAVPVKADSISETEQRGKELQKQKEAAENEKSSLASQLNQVISDMQETEKKLTEKQDEIKKAQDELVQAQIQENDQYEAMKLRIKYMYENGNASLLEILFSAKSMGDLLNKAEYVQSISEYDRNMLEKYEKLTKEIEEKEAALEKEEEELKTLQNDLIAKRNSVNQLLAEKEVQISSLEDQIGANAAKLQELIKEAEEAKRRQEEAAAAKRAAEEAARKAALAAQQAASYPEAVQVPVVPVPGILMYLETDHWLIRLQVRGSQVGTATVLRPQQVLPAGMMESILGVRQARRSMHQQQDRCYSGI